MYKKNSILPKQHKLWQSFCFVQDLLKVLGLILKRIPQCLCYYALHFIHEETEIEENLETFLHVHMYVVYIHVCMHICLWTFICRGVCRPEIDLSCYPQLLPTLPTREESLLNPWHVDSSYYNQKACPGDPPVILLGIQTIGLHISAMLRILQ